MTRRFAYIFYTASYIIAGMIWLFIPLIAVFWLLGLWDDMEASRGVIIASFLAVVIWAAGRLVLNGVKDG